MKVAVVIAAAVAKLNFFCCRIHPQCYFQMARYFYPTKKIAGTNGGMLSNRRELPQSRHTFYCITIRLRVALFPSEYASDS